MKYMKSLFAVLLFFGMSAFTFTTSEVESLDKNRKDEIILQNELEGTWSVVKDTSHVEFKISNMWVGNVKGTMSGVEGKAVFKQNFNNSSVKLTIYPKTVDTGINKRDEHLRSEDFFEVENYPEIRFEGSSFSKGENVNGFIVTGNLTIKEYTHEEKVHVILEKIEGNTAVFTGHALIDRTQYGLDIWSGMGVGDEAEISFTIVAKK